MATDAKNVYQSFVKRIASELPTLTPFYPGLNGSKEGINSWIEPRMFGVRRLPSQTTERWGTWRFQIITFAVIDADTFGIYDHMVLADQVDAAFSTKGMDIKDWDTVGDPLLGTMQFSEVDIEEVDTGDPSTLSALCEWTGWLII